jgi:septum formation protein
LSVIQAETPALVLASASSARRAVLEAAGLRFTAQAAHVDEDAVKQGAKAEGLKPGETALILSELKAQRLSRRHRDALVIGCDQVLVCEGAWFDKPADRTAAAAHLRALRDKTHVLETGLVCMKNEQVVWHHLVRPKLTMRPFSDAFLDAYLDAEGDAVLSSVGAYRLEGLGAQLFDAIEGEHSAILGLPLLPLLGFLRQHGVLLA